MERITSAEANIRLRRQEKPSLFLEPEGSLPCSQEPTTGSYSEPDESSAHPHILVPDNIL
jgi:hypothetical protein